MKIYLVARPLVKKEDVILSQLPGIIENAVEILEPDAMEMARPTLRGRWPSNGLLLPDPLNAKVLAVSRLGLQINAMLF